MSEATMETTDNEADGEAAPGGRSSRKVLIAIAAVAVLAAGGWYGYSYLETQKAERAQAEARAAAQKKAAQQKAAQDAGRNDEDAKIAAELQRQKVAADEALRQAQEDRDRVARELAELQALQGGKRRAK